MSLEFLKKETPDIFYGSGFHTNGLSEGKVVAFQMHHHDFAVGSTQQIEFDTYEQATAFLLGMNTMLMQNNA